MVSKIKNKNNKKRYITVKNTTGHCIVDYQANTYAYHGRTAKRRTFYYLKEQDRTEQNNKLKQIDCFVGGTVTGKHKKRKRRTRNVSIGHDTKISDYVTCKAVNRKIGGF